MVTAQSNEATFATTGGVIDTPAAVVSVCPVVLAAPDRGERLQLRVSAPVTGRELPIILFAHGFGSSMDGYAPLADYWAAHGFVVIQPTFPDSKRLGFKPDDPRWPLIWRIRIADMKRILDQLDVIEGAVPGLEGRLGRERIAAVGHSFGAHTVGVLLGARVMHPDGKQYEALSDARIKAGVLLAAGGRGGADLSPFAAEHFPYLNINYDEMTTPTLVVAGDRDRSPLTVRGPDWFTDAYTLSPGADWLLTLYEAEHMLGGISGYLVTETTDENPDRVAMVRRLTWAYLRTALYPADPAWRAACAELNQAPHPLGRVESK
ncbi:alpha/beta hydrolase family protein [Brenneria tiliae]|uniref:alpha/beta hydrolase family protein n=1 Tax=Brenneria tiliae TaxID=2914984 RepID=UPI002014FFF4|nr:alpha/beta fold hydrolase [Brenneria tiliae]MCL2898492.1 alpha/beta fold hydrolase [Brenneria tiliae]MCL2902966.1 alpha/beta fold hydrolase [Brenneria tiliae]